MKNKKSIVFASIAAGFFLLFLILTILVKFVDVRSISTKSVGLEVGLSSLNKVFLANEYNKGIDLGTDILLYLSIFSFVFLVGLGVYQLVTRKSFKKVDKDIYFIGGLAVLMVILWLFFDKVAIINYRPINMGDKLESSYPSTHVLVTTFLTLSTFNLYGKYVNKNLVKVVEIVAAMFIIMFVCVGRIAAGMHYFTDVIGGLFLGLGLYFTYETLKHLFLNENKEEEQKNV